MSRGKGIARLYQTGGPNLVAYRLGFLFTKIETEEDKIRHNDVLDEVLDIINKDYPQDGKLSNEESRFLQFMVEVMYKPVKREKRLLYRLAEQILHLGQMKP